MNELFQTALKFVLKWEGGFVDDPDDHGGATNKGITQYTYNSYLKSIGQASKPVKNITQAEVEAIYYKRFWLTTKCDTMSRQFAVLAFDTAVNMGAGVVKATGMTRVQEFMQAAEYKYPDKFIAAKEAKYRVFANTPDRDKEGNIIKDKNGNPIYSQRKYLNGWLNRLNAVKKFIKTI